MAFFIFAYHGGESQETPEQIEAEIARWQKWFDGIGDNIIDPGNPVGVPKTVSVSGVTDDGGANPLLGYTIIQAEDMNAAVAMAKNCPIVGDGSGTVEVAEIHEMPT